MVVFPKKNDDGTFEWTCPVCMLDNRVYAKKTKNVECLACGNRFTLNKKLNGCEHG